MSRITPRSKSIMIMTLLGLFVIVGHYILWHYALPNFPLIILIVRTALASLCIFGMALLLMRVQGIPSRRIFALVLGLYGLASVVTLIVNLSNDTYIADNATSQVQLLSPIVMTYGNIYVYLFLLYPISLLRIGKTTIWQYITYLLPALLLGVIYYAMVAIFGLSLEPIDSWQEFFADIWRVDIWFRLAFLIYPLWMLIKILQYKACYQQWCQQNYSESGYIETEWLKYYIFGYILLLVSYLVVMLGHNPQSLLMHLICFFSFFSFSLYHVLRQAAPANIMQTSSVNCGTMEQGDLLDKNAQHRCGFTDMMPTYKATLERWMESEKPYLNKDFKLLDVMEVLPLNRSYLSRVFNEMYGETFLSFVMRYRLEQSCILLRDHIQEPIASVAFKCGFSSPSVFARAFLRSKGITPKEYQVQCQHSSTPDSPSSKTA
ncbi:MAG: AraC family transcriptional regulator [Mucinivorans sp.]